MVAYWTVISCVVREEGRAFNLFSHRENVSDSFSTSLASAWKEISSNRQINWIGCRGWEQELFLHSVVFCGRHCPWLVKQAWWCLSLLTFLGRPHLAQRLQFLQASTRCLCVSPADWAGFLIGTILWMVSLISGWLANSIFFRNGWVPLEWALQDSEKRRPLIGGGLWEDCSIVLKHGFSVSRRVYFPWLL